MCEENVYKNRIELSKRKEENDRMKNKINKNEQKKEKERKKI